MRRMIVNGISGDPLSAMLHSLIHEQIRVCGRSPLEIIVKARQIVTQTDKLLTGHECRHQGVVVGGEFEGL